MTDEKLIIIISISLIFSFIIMILVHKMRVQQSLLIPAPKRRKKYKKIYKPTNERWLRIKDSVKYKSIKQLIKLTKLSPTTVYRCIELYKYGSQNDIHEFETGQRSVSSLVKEIGLDRKK